VIDWSGGAINWYQNYHDEKILEIRREGLKTFPDI
jgi:hypothetical protein